MSFNDIPVRENGQLAIASWWNLLRTAGIALEGSGTITETQVTLTNNQTSAANVTGLSFSGATYRSAKVDYQVYINTTGGGAEERAESGTLDLIYKTTAASWELYQTSQVGSSGVSFSVTAAGQVQYTSENVGGTPDKYIMKFKAQQMGIES